MIESEESELSLTIIYNFIFYLLLHAVPCSKTVYQTHLMG
jgi:hypothetical protein